MLSCSYRRGIYFQLFEEPILPPPSIIVRLPNLISIFTLSQYFSIEESVEIILVENESFGAAGVHRQQIASVTVPIPERFRGPKGDPVIEVTLTLQFREKEATMDATLGAKIMR
jgi:hypothetical protein